MSEDWKRKMHPNEVLCRRWVDEVWNDGRTAVVDELFAEDGTAVYPYLARDDNRMTGREEYKEFIRRVKAHFHQVRVEISDITADELKVVALCTFKALPRDTAEPPLNLQSLCLYKIENGLISEIWNNVEFSGDDLRVIAKDAKV